MHSSASARVSKVSIAAGILLVLMAMMLPVCHLHPLLDTAAPDHCTICVSLHAALPVGVHAPPITTPQLVAGHVIIASVATQIRFTPRYAASRAPPLPAC